MTKKIRFLTLVLAVLMIASAVSMTACGDKADPAATTGGPAVTNQPGDNSGEGTQQTDAPVVTGPVFEKKDYEGETFTVLTRAHDAASYKAYYIITPESDSTDTMDNKTYLRNSRVEDYYNIKFSFNEQASDFNSLVQKSFNDGVAYDLMLGLRGSLAKLIADGYLYDWNKLNIDYTTPWWDQNAKADLAVNGKSFLMANDVTISRFSGARFFYWNKRIVKDYKLTDPYTYMDKNEWNLDNFLAMVSGVKTNAEGLEGLGTYGLLVETGVINGVHAHMAAGMGIRLAEKDSSGKWVSNLADNQEKVENIFDKMKVVFQDKSCALDMTTAKSLDTKGEGAGQSNVYNWGRALFAKGHFLFTQTSITCCTQFVDMEDEYGVAPNPKYNADQKNYIHKDDPNSLIFAVMNADPIDLDFDRLTNVIDYWAYQSSITVSPEYYEVTIKTKRAYEAKAGDVVDLVKATIYTELAECITDAKLHAALDDAYNMGSIATQLKARESLISAWLNKVNNMNP